MKNITKLLLLSFVVSVLWSCMQEPVEDVPEPETTAVRDDEEYERRKIERERERREVIDRTARRFSGEKCDDQDKNHECRDYCDDVYSRKSDRDDCEEDLTVAQVEAVKEVYDILEKPREDDLEGIDSEAFDLYLNVSIESFDKIIGKYSSREAERVLAWLISDSESAEIFQGEDDDFETFESLLEEFAGNFSTDITKPFLKRVDRDELWVVALDAGDESLIEWFHDYINEKNSDCESDTETRACFAIYCKIGEEIGDDGRSDWLDTDIMESYLDDIIDAKVNSANAEQIAKFWKTGESTWTHSDENNGDFGDSGDLTDDDWVNQLCNGLTDGDAA